MVLDDVDVDRDVDCILELAHTGEPGDGKNFICRSRRVDPGAPRRSAATWCGTPPDSTPA